MESELINSVIKMRQHQQEYFRYRNSNDLRAAKKWEIIVDQLLKRLTATQENKQNPDPEQTDLFDWKI